VSEQQKQREMTMDEVRSALENIARDPEHRDHFKALKMLRSEEASSAVLPEPLTDEEVVLRLARIMRPAGPENCQIAFHRAFPRSKKTVTSAPRIEAEDLTEEDRDIVNRVTSLPMLYRLFPEIKRNGVPKGYPTTKGLAAQLRFVREQATRMLLERERERMKALEAENRDDDPNPGTDAA